MSSPAAARPLGEGSMHRTLTWVVVCVVAALLAAVAPQQTLAQQAPPAPAEISVKPVPGRLGAQVRGFSERSVQALGLSQAHAILVEFPYPGSPAERAGLRPGDVILELEGAAVGPLNTFIPALQRIGGGNVATLG